MKVTVKYHNSYAPETPSTFEFEVGTFDEVYIGAKDGLLSIGNPDNTKVLIIKTIDLVGITGE